MGVRTRAGVNRDVNAHCFDDRTRRLNAPDVISAGRFRLVGEWGGKCCGGAAASPSEDELRQMLSESSDRHMVFLAHVRNGTHFVLLTGWNSSAAAFDVNDPGFDRTTYLYDDIGDLIIYSTVPSPNAFVPMPYPLFKQYDYRWANDVMETTTIAKVGCLMSSTAMALRAHGINISKSTAVDPGSLNRWLRENGGYDGSNDMYESKIPAISPDRISWNATQGMHTSNDITVHSIAASLSSGQPVIANVMHGRHFVLVIGMSSKTGANPTLYVNDPGFYRTSYMYDEVVGWRLFNMSF